MSNEGKRVRAHYTGTFDDGTVFDSSVERGEPLEFVCMAGQMIPGFDAAVKEMEVGETKNVHLPASEAYGEHDEQLVQTIPTAQIPGAEDLPVGQRIYLQGPGGQPIPALVVEVTDETVTFDLNHEMAGHRIARLHRKEMGTGDLDAQKEHLVVVVMIGAALACSVFSQSGADTTM